MNYLDGLLASHCLNNEVVTYCLKVLKDFIGSGSFKHRVAPLISFERLKDIRKLYKKDLPKLKTITFLICDLISSQEKICSVYELNTGISILLNILYKQKENIVIGECIASTLTNLINKLDRVPTEMETANSLELIYEVLSTVMFEPKPCCCLLELLHSIVSRQSAVKSYVCSNQNFLSLFKEMLNHHNIPSTGCLLGHEKQISNIRVICEELIEFNPN